MHRAYVVDIDAIVAANVVVASVVVASVVAAVVILLLLMRARISVLML